MKIVAIAIGLTAVATLPADAQSGFEVGEPVALVSDSDSWVMQPRWSHDGNSLLVTGSNYKGLWVVDLTGESRQITDDAAAGFGASWSGDDSMVLTRVARYDDLRRFNAIKTFSVADGSFEILADYSPSPYSLPAWTRSGAAVWRDDDRFVVQQVSAKEGQNSPGSIVVPLNNKISSISEIDMSITTIGESATGDILNLVRSPDGSRIAYEVLGGGMFVVNADGTNRTDIGPGNRPRWSPDGQWLVFSRIEDDGHRFTSAEIYVVRADGSSLLQLTNTSGVLEMNPDWSPDSRFIAYDDSGKIYLLPISATN